MSINIAQMFSEGLNLEIENFMKRDDSFRAEFVGGLNKFGISQELPKASIALNNRTKLLLNECNKAGILFPTNYLLAYDLCKYLESAYYDELGSSIEELNDSISDFLNLKGLKKLRKYKSSLINIENILEATSDYYRSITDYMYNFDMKKNGHKVVDSALDECTSLAQRIKVIGYHEKYHKEMDNKEVLEYIKSLK